MNEKILFWIDFGFVHFGIANAIQKKFESDLYAIIDVNDKAKKFFQMQKIVNFQKTWYYLDQIKPPWKSPDIEYLKNFEKKYEIDIWKIAYGDRAFFKFNKFYKFSHDEILSIMERECKFFEKILSECNPNFLILSTTNAHNTYLLEKLCKAKKIRVLMLSGTRVGNKLLISEEFDKIDSSDKESTDFSARNTEYNDLKKYFQKFDTSKIVKKSRSQGFESNLSSRYKAIFRFFFSPVTESYKNRFSYYGRTKLKLLSEKIKRRILLKTRQSFFNKNCLKKIDDKTPFVYFPMHLEPERVLLIDTPYFDDQIYVITCIAKSLPVGYKLYVKEHPWMKIGSSTSGPWRPTSYYKQIIALPNVEFLHPSLTRDQILPKCSLVVTIAGTTGIEASLFHKPTIVIKDSDYPLIPSVHKLDKIDDLSFLIRKLISEKQDYDISKYLQLYDSNTFEADLIQIGTDFSYKFGFKGPNIDGELPNQGVEEFLLEHKSDFDTIANAYVKKINKITISNGRTN